MTLLTEVGIRSAACIQNPVQGNFRATSYDLSINVIIDEKGHRSDHICLAPGEMATVVSEEILQLPANVTGVAHYLTRLTKKGIWSQTIGIIDPFWSGPLSTTIVNQSKSPQSLRKGDVYIRVSFFDHAVTPNQYGAGQFTHAAYTRQVEADTATYMPRSFLDSEKISLRAAEAVSKQLTQVAATWVGIAAVLFALISLFAPFATNAASKTYWESFVADRERDRVTQLASAEARFAEQARTIDDLKRQIELLIEQVSKTTPSSKPK